MYAKHPLKSQPISPDISPSKYGNYSEFEKESLYQTLIQNPKLMEKFRQFKEVYNHK